MLISHLITQRKQIIKLGQITKRKKKSSRGELNLALQVEGRPR